MIQNNKHNNQKIYCRSLINKYQENKNYFVKKCQNLIKLIQFNKKNNYK